VQVRPVAGDLLDRVAVGVPEVQERPATDVRELALIGLDEARLDAAADASRSMRA
jgi:hypothetical protein